MVQLALFKMGKLNRKKYVDLIAVLQFTIHRGQGMGWDSVNYRGRYYPGGNGWKDEQIKLKWYYKIYESENQQMINYR
jgi:hypothetical protein